MTIPMVDLKGQYESLKSEIDSAIIEALGETRFILGPNVQAFDREAAEYLGVGHAISCASGTDALHLALLAAGIEAGDEVITSAFTFIATAEAIRYIGATPVFVDIQPDSFNLDPHKIRDAITERTRAILPVHLFGQPADMDEITAIAEEFNLLVVEDCAQSFGSRYRDRVTGSIGAVGAFSFFPSKNLGCYGDGGMVTTNDDAIASRIRMLRNHGSSQQYHHDVIGYNSRLDELQAVILRIKLKHIDDYNSQRLRWRRPTMSGSTATASSCQRFPAIAITYSTSTRCSATSATRCARPCWRVTLPARSTTRSRCTGKRPLPIPRNPTCRSPRKPPAAACRCRYSRK